MNVSSRASHVTTDAHWVGNARVQITTLRETLMSTALKFVTHQMSLDCEIPDAQSKRCTSKTKKFQ